jgi:hypothetical protein
MTTGAAESRQQSEVLSAALTYDDLGWASLGCSAGVRLPSPSLPHRRLCRLPTGALFHSHHPRQPVGIDAAKASIQTGAGLQVPGRGTMSASSPGVCVPKVFRSRPFLCFMLC